MSLKILCLEDDDIDFEIINLQLLKSKMDVNAKMVDTRENFLHELDAFQPDVILSDHSLPTFNSIEALTICRAKKLHIPFILVTGAVSDEFAVSCIKRGADDYVLKSNLSRLPSAIRNALKHKATEEAKLLAVNSLAEQNLELTKINKELDGLVYSVSHNLRAPLMSVLGLINLAKFETSKDTMQHYHEMMEKSVHKLDDTLKEILEYARNARQEPEIDKIDFKEIINETLDKMQFMSGVDNIRISVTVIDPLPFYSDNYRISVILNNLISNAIKYYDEKKENPFFNIAVTVGEEKATLEFQDNGIGIAETAMSKIFDMFFRATNKTDGSGLGLYIVKEAVDKLSGDIQMETLLGKGTTFKINIPNRQEI
jgi:signal transduction histidine kinase